MGKYDRDWSWIIASLRNSRWGEAGVTGNDDLLVDGVETVEDDKPSDSHAFNGANTSRNRGNDLFAATTVGMGGMGGGGASVFGGRSKKLRAVTDLWRFGVLLTRTRRRSLPVVTSPFLSSD